MKTCLSILLSFIFIASNAQITSTFSTDADGWTFYSNATPITVNYQTANGNPGGFVSVTYSSNTSLTTQNWIAPSKFWGNHLVRSFGMNLKFDLQQSQAGTASGYDVRIESGGTFLNYTLPVKPAVAPAWSSYTLSIDANTLWKFNGTATNATNAQIKSVLRNVTSIEIRGTYATNASYTSGLDNVILEQQILPLAPAPTSLSASSGKPGQVISINGANFDPAPASNAVYFGHIRAVVQAATISRLDVIVPVGATFGPITITNTTTGLTAETLKPFNPIFDGGGRIIPASFAPKVDIPTIGMEGVFVADIDGDGWSDLAVTNNNADDVIDIYRNLGTGGDITAASFATKVTIPAPPIGGSGVNGAGLWFADLDGDGMVDAVTSNASSAFSSVFVTLRNISTPGTIAFEAPEYWPGGSDETPIALIADLDGDGRPELMGGEGSLSSAGFYYFWANQNLSTPGDIDFGAPITFYNGSVINAFAVVVSGDLDGDGKNELIVTHNFGQMTTVLNNTSTPGVPSFGNAFTFPTNQYNNSLQIIDMNLDGKNDLVYKISGESGIHIRLNAHASGPLLFSDFSTDVIIASDLGTYGGINIVDANGDGKPDIAATDNSDVGIYENNYSGGVFDASVFVPAYQYLGSSSYPTSPMIADLNHDTKPDLILGVTNSSPNKFSIFQNKNIHAPVISLNTVSPLAAPVGATVTITGNNFSSVASENKVSFGAVHATILSATPNLITAQVPPGASYAPVSVTKDGLTSRYHLPFHTTFSSGVTFDNTSFAPPVSFTLAGSAYDIDGSDLTRDGKPDLIANGAGGATYTFRNTHVSGSISASSLTADDVLANFNLSKLEDFDGDGYQDVAAASGRIRKNNSTASDISFQPEISLVLGATIGSYADLNLDGKIDMVFTSLTSGGNLLQVLENRTTPYTTNFVTSGVFGSFSNVINYGMPDNGGTVTTVDFDNDGFPDAIATNPAPDNISIFRNKGLFKISTSQFTRVELAVGDSPGRIYNADLDVDGKVDLIVTYNGGANPTTLSVFHNQSTPGTITFNRVDITLPSSATIAHVDDLDGDGKPEIIVTSEAGNRFSIFKNVHTTGPITAASFAAPFNTTVTAPRGLYTSDINLDGKPEIIITRAAGLLLVYENLIVTPTISGFTPPSGWVGTTVTITGTNFSLTPASNIVTFNGTTAAVTASTSTSITTTVPSGATTGTITVSVGASTATSATSFTVLLPTITSFTPASGPIGTTVTITGTNFSTTPASNSVKFNGTTAAVTASTASSITTTVPAGATTGTITVTVAGNTATSATPFTVTVVSLPTITSFTPSSGATGTAVTITGTNFSPSPSSNIVNFNGSAATVTASTATTITTTVPSAATTGKITVTVAGNTATSVTDFTVTTAGVVPPIINTTPLATSIGGKITIDLIPLIVVTNSSLDLTSLKVIINPASTASTSITPTGILTIDYNGLKFNGTDNLRIEACTIAGSCTQQTFSIEVNGEIIVYNGVSPDGMNPIFYLEYIDVFQETKDNTVTIFNRWGDEVWKGNNYDNKAIVFSGRSSSGNDLPTGIYFYKLEFTSGKKMQTGYLSLKSTK